MSAKSEARAQYDEGENDDTEGRLVVVKMFVLMRKIEREQLDDEAKRRGINRGSLIRLILRGYSKFHTDPYVEDGNIDDIRSDQADTI